MRVRNLNAGAYNADGTVNINNFTATGPFYVYQEPVGLRDIASKAYVDLKTTSFDTAYFTSGTLAVARMPAFIGQLSKPAGSAAVTVSVGNTAAAGTYSSITVGAHGFVTAAGQLSSADVPSFSWTKITSGKPTTLAGWGITNALAKSGGTVTGPINISGAAAQTNPLHAVTKSIADAAISGMTAGIITYRTGDIRLLPTAGTPAGYLRCNGAVLNKTSYASLYAVVGVGYSSYVANIGAGRPWAQQYDINLDQRSDITGWVEETPFPVHIHAAQTFVTKNRVYLVGGFIDSTPTSAVYYAPINADGTLGAWATAPLSLPVGLGYGTAVVTKNRVYIIGAAVNGAASGAVYTAPINADGSLGAWDLHPYSTPLLTHQPQVFAVKGRVYVVGGSTYKTFRADIDVNGFLWPFIDTYNDTPYNAYGGAVAVVKDRVYILGGDNSTMGSSNKVLMSTIGIDGLLGPWSTTTDLPFTYYVGNAYVTRNAVYLLSGGVNGVTVSQVWRCAINADGTLGGWVSGTSTTQAVAFSSMFTTKNKIYLVGNVGQNHVLGATIIGGTNDCSTYYGSAVSTLPVTDFQIPTITSNEGIGLYAYIKT